MKKRVWKRGFKVGKLEGNQVQGRAHWKHQVGHTLGEMTIRKKGFGPIACFAKYEDAVRYSKEYSVLYPDSIFPCVYLESREDEMYCPINGTRSIANAVIPKGTVYADKIIVFES